MIGGALTLIKALGARGWPLTLALACGVPAALSGCQEEESRSVIIARRLAHTPEGKLERVIERLSSALADASAASNSGVISQRTCDYQIIPPEGPDSPYRAEIVIETLTALDGAMAAEMVPQFDEPVVEEGEEGELVEEEPMPAGRSAALSLANEARTFKTATYELVYQDDRWQLPVKPEGPTEKIEKICFEYALGLQ